MESVRAEGRVMTKPQTNNRVKDLKLISSSDTFRRTLQHYRRNLGISQQELADLARISQVGLSHFETGRTRLSPSALDRVRKALLELIRDRAKAVGFFPISPSVLSLGDDLQVGA